MSRVIAVTVVVAACLGCSPHPWPFYQPDIRDQGAIYLEQFISAVNEGRETEAAACWDPKKQEQGFETASFLRWAMDQYCAVSPHYRLAAWEPTWDQNITAVVALYPTSSSTSPLWCEGWKVDLAYPGFRIDGIERDGDLVSCP